MIKCMTLSPQKGPWIGTPNTKGLLAIRVVVRQECHRVTASLARTAPTEWISNTNLGVFFRARFQD